MLIGTQVVAKGHHFPLLTLVGVVDADLGLDGGDLRAGERSFQLLHQVAGRAGRAEQPGLVLVQTFHPENPVMRALVADDRDRFLRLEADERERHGNPPFGRLAALIISGDSEDAAEFAARAYARSTPHLPGVEVFGPAPAPLPDFARAASQALPGQGAPQRADSTGHARLAGAREAAVQRAHPGRYRPV